MTEIQSVEKVPEIMAHNGASSSRELKIQNGPGDRINTKAHALNSTDGKKSIYGSLLFDFHVLCLLAI